MPIVGEVCQVLESVAPPTLAEPWDNVGLLVGAEDWSADRVMLTIDLTETVLEEAIEAKTGLVVAYHPLIFAPLKRITDAAGKGRVVLGAARAGIAVYSPHTAIDACAGGVNDWLAEGIGAGDVRALRPHEGLPASEECKIVTFCPVDAAERIRRALSTVGAGQIGKYAMCSFEIHGEGTFLASEEASPVVGRKGVVERVREVRLEMVAPSASLGLAVATLRQFHPYETPPIEIYQLRGRPERGVGAGRRVMLDRGASLAELVERVKSHLGTSAVVMAEGRNAPEKISVVGVCAGSGGALLEAALEHGCQAYFTGEMGHHDILKAQELGCSVILAGHTNTERGYLPRLADVLKERLPNLDVRVSTRDREPLKVR